MPETYGLPEPTPDRAEQALDVAAEAIAGRSEVRTVLLYVALVLLIIGPLPLLAAVPAILLIATDPRL